MADSQQKKVDYYQRNADGEWQSGQLEAGQNLEISCGDYQAQLIFEDIYEDVVF